ncbi:MAG TPA: helix-turn-helix domain-containing protein [bacterium]
MTAERYLSIDDVAARFGVNQSTVYRLAQRGVLPGFKIGVQWRFSPRELEAWVARQSRRRRGAKTSRS